MLSSELEKIRPKIDRLVGIAKAGVPIACSASLAAGIPMGYTRPIAKSGYGEHSSLESELRDRDEVALVDDIVTTMDTKVVARGAVLTSAEARGLVGVRCERALVVVDREQHADHDGDLSIHALVRLRTDGLNWMQDVAEPWETRVVRAYLEDASVFQDETRREQLLRELGVG
jgi:orotate phosphoribosyltransferase